MYTPPTIYFIGQAAGWVFHAAAFACHSPKAEPNWYLHQELVAAMICTTRSVKSLQTLKMFLAV